MRGNQYIFKKSLEINNSKSSSAVGVRNKEKDFINYTNQ